MNNNAPNRMGCSTWTMIGVVGFLAVIGIVLVVALGGILLLKPGRSGSEVSASAPPIAVSATEAPVLPVSEAVAPVEAASPASPSESGAGETSVAQSSQSGAVTVVPDPEQTGPAITLNPPAAAPGSKVVIQGSGWPQGAQVVMFLMPTDPPPFAVGWATAGNDGAFSTEIIAPTDARWLDESPIPIVAMIEGQNVKAQAQLNIMTPSDEMRPPDEVIIVPVSFEATPIAPPPPAAVPSLSSNANLNVRSGPGTNFDVLGVLRPGDRAEITGRSADATWWRIEYAASRQGSGWVSAAYVTAQNAGQVPVVDVAPPPAQPTPAPQQQTEMPFWRGEYYNNQDLSGSPVFTRDDPYLSFDWGAWLAGRSHPGRSFLGVLDAYHEFPGR